MKKGKKHNMSEKFQSKEKEQSVQDPEINAEDQATQDQATAQEPQDGQEDTVEAKLAKCESQIAELNDRLLRQMAEFDNYRKRTLKEKAELILNGSAGIVTDILPVIDDLERAVSNSSKSDDYNALKEGVELIYNKFMHILEQKGLQKISPKNEPFDTDFHEAIAMIPAPDEASKGMVIDCAIDGYKLNDKVLRHAKVAVGQ